MFSLIQKVKLLFYSFMVILDPGVGGKVFYKYSNNIKNTILLLLIKEDLEKVHIKSLFLGLNNTLKILSIS